MKQGRILFSLISLQPHKLLTIQFIASKGYDVEMLEPNRQKGVKTADIKMLGNNWEMKSPKGRGKYTIQHAFKAAARQSDYLVFDMRHMSVSLEQSGINKIRLEMNHSKTVRRILIITRSNELIDLVK